MYEQQEIVPIKKEELLNHVSIILNDGFRLMQISCTKGENSYVVDYTFDKELKFYGVRVEIPLENPELPTISAICAPAFLYENELHDLFGIKIDNISIDFKGKFYRLATQAPYSTIED